MKAIGLMQYGDKSVLQEIEMQTPLLGDTDVLIEVYAAGINPVDWKIREGLLQDVISYDFPARFRMGCCRFSCCYRAKRNSM